MMPILLSVDSEFTSLFPPGKIDLLVQFIERQADTRLRNLRLGISCFICLLE
jgi:hypothetical protein